MGNTTSMDDINNTKLNLDKDAEEKKNPVSKEEI